MKMRMLQMQFEHEIALKKLEIDHMQREVERKRGTETRP